AEGRLARACLDGARDRVARATGAEAAGVTFVSCGTEAVNLAILGAGSLLRPGRRAVAFASDHPAVLTAIGRLRESGRDVSILPVDRAAHADPSTIPADAGFVTCDAANFELGTLAPIEPILERCQEVGALLHVNACQSFAYLNLPEADLISVSGHKIGAGGGGVLLTRASVRLEPLLTGGAAERSRRAGREDLRDAVAIAHAAELAAVERSRLRDRMGPLGLRLREGLAGAGVTPTGSEPRLPNFATGYIPGRKAEDVLL